MDREQLLNKIYQKKSTDRKGFDFDSLWHPPISQYLTTQDVQQLNAIALSAKYNARPKEKYKMMDDILRQRGFTRFHAGTNRLVYKSEYDSSFVLKVGIDKVGITDNPAEYYNQFVLKPFCCKIFDVTPCGTVAMVERVNPIKNRQQFKEIANDVFFTIVAEFTGLIMEDIGCNFFMNWGTRDGFGPVILDYPYTYSMDLSKMKCTHIDKQTGKVCGGLIDYDIGFNTLVCECCGARYTARELGKTNHASTIEMKLSDLEKKVKENNMEKFIVSATINGKTFSNGSQVDDSMIKPVNRQRADKMYMQRMVGSRFNTTPMVEKIKTSVTIRTGNEHKDVDKPIHKESVPAQKVEEKKQPVTEPIVAHVEFASDRNTVIPVDKAEEIKKAVCKTQPNDIVLPNGQIIRPIGNDNEPINHAPKMVEQQVNTDAVINKADDKPVEVFNVEADQEPVDTKVDEKLEISAKAFMKRDVITEFVRVKEGNWLDEYGMNYDENQCMSAVADMVNFIEGQVMHTFGVDFNSAHALVQEIVEGDFPAGNVPQEAAHTMDDDGLSKEEKLAEQYDIDPDASAVDSRVKSRIKDF